MTKVAQASGKMRWALNIGLGIAVVCILAAGLLLGRGTGACDAANKGLAANGAIFLRAYGATDPSGARALARKYGYPLALIPPHPLPARGQTKRQREQAAAFFRDALARLQAARC